ncbi:MAG: hypothetical protein AAF804_11385, partial [Bacteroidota bacterium]
AGKYARQRSIRLRSYVERHDNSILDLEVDLLDLGLTGDQGAPLPQAGDVIGILPRNSQAQSDQLADLLAEDATDQFFLSKRHESDPGRYYTKQEALACLALNPLRPATLYRLKEKLIKNKAKPRFGHEPLLAHELTLEALLQIHEESPEDAAIILGHGHVCDLLLAFPGILTLSDLCETQGAIYRRVYTLSGITRDQEGQAQAVQFLVALGVGYQVPPEGFHPGTSYPGVCSSYLRQLLLDKGAAASAEVFIQPRPFGGPEKNRTLIPGRAWPKPDQEFLTKLAQPTLLVGAGSGISGIRAILEERQYWQRLGYQIGSSTLIFGLRNQYRDYLYQDEFEAWESEGLIERILLAESRPDQGEKTYVQDLLVQNVCRSELQELAQERRALVVCGDKKMGITLTDGCLPILLAAEGTDVGDLDREEVYALFLKGQAQVQLLKEQRLIIRSTSGSRYPKKPISFEEVYEGYFRK